MDLTHRTPEDYFNELINCIEKANRQFKDFDKHATENATADRPDKAADFVDTYCTDFNDSLEEILTTLGAANENFYYTYEYDAVAYEILNLEKVLADLQAHKSMYIARIKEATVFVPQGSLAVWIDDFEDLQDISDELEERFSGIGI
ncbi:hypothetical protein [Pedobacter sp. SYSU D00535]|uniref:hypothetical protein n=1 Tax=Pedobacter sp. SYSU D00535 TaxID=2810308 RepID=UPI001A9771B9|nr:hypothetical protein [Pedobacter sp. SYSU D00535]